jgi:hypothetical protein
MVPKGLGGTGPATTWSHGRDPPAVARAAQQRSTPKTTRQEVWWLLAPVRMSIVAADRGRFGKAPSMNCSAGLVHCQCRSLIWCQRNVTKTKEIPILFDQGDVTTWTPRSGEEIQSILCCQAWRRLLAVDGSWGNPRKGPDVHDKPRAERLEGLVRLCLERGTMAKLYTMPASWQGLWEAQKEDARPARNARCPWLQHRTWRPTSRPSATT